MSARPPGRPFPLGRPEDVPPWARHPEYWVRTQYTSPSGEPYYYFAYRPPPSRYPGFRAPQVQETWITRRQYYRMARGQSREAYQAERARRARDEGFRPTNAARYWSNVDSWRLQRARETGRLMGRREASMDPRFKADLAVILTYRRQEERERRGPGGRPGAVPGPDRSPQGAMAQALVRMGRRQPWWPWDVGDTPDAERSRRFHHSPT